MIDDNLVLLTLDLDIPNLWENALVQNFPKTDFTIKQGHPSSEDSFSGLLNINKGDFNEINSFLVDNYPLVSLDNFYSESGIYHFRTPDPILPMLIRNSKSVLSWPVKLMEKNKRVKFVLRGEDVDSIMVPLEDQNVDVKKFSKVKIDFNMKDLLTPKQREILSPSLKYGYYEFPKKINLNELSRKIGVSPSTLCVHLQKIESKILNSPYQELIFNVG